MVGNILNQSTYNKKQNKKTIIIAENAAKWIKIFLNEIEEK